MFYSYAIINIHLNIIMYKYTYVGYSCQDRASYEIKKEYPFYVAITPSRAVTTCKAE